MSNFRIPDQKYTQPYASIWGTIQEVIIAIANIFCLADEEIYETVINKSDKLNQVCSIYKLKLANRTCET